MGYAKKVVLHTRSGYRPELNSLVAQFMKDGVALVAVVGEDCSKIEDIIDELCVGDGLDAYEMITTSHQGESVKDVVEFAQFCFEDFGQEVQLVEF